MLFWFIVGDGFNVDRLVHMRKRKTGAPLLDPSGRRIVRRSVRVDVPVRELWRLAQYINYRAFGAYAAGTARRIPMWLNAPEPDASLPGRDKGRLIGRWVLGFPPLRLLFGDLKTYLKECRQCGQWFVDLTRNRTKKQCSETCANRWWNRERRRTGATGQRQPVRGRNLKLRAAMAGSTRPRLKRTVGQRAQRHGA